MTRSAQLREPARTAERERHRRPGQPRDAVRSRVEQLHRRPPACHAAACPDAPSLGLARHGAGCEVPQTARYSAGVIDFSSGSVFKLNPCKTEDIAPAVAPLVIPGEQIVSCFKAVRDFVVFTDKRLIAVNVQGMTGKKRDVTSLPYSKIQAFSIETAGTFDLDAELDLWFSGLGKVRLEFKGNSDIRQLGHMIASYVL